MTRRFFLAFLSLFFVLSVNAAVAETRAPYAWQDAFVRETPMKVSAGYVVLKNPTAKADALIAAKADWAGRIELHNVKANEKGVLQMLRVETLDLPARGTLALRPGGLHLMIFDLKTPLKAGEKKSITLQFKNAGEIVVPFDVQPISYGGEQAMKKPDAAHHHAH